jgi:putative endonuclease
MEEPKEVAQRRQGKVYIDDTWFVYLLRCAGGSLYSGITTDLDRRCQQHGDGKASRYRGRRRPVALVYHETIAGRSLPLKREAAIKALSRQDKEVLIQNAG